MNMSQQRSTLGERIRLERERLGLTTQRELAKLLRISRESVTQWESGATKPNQRRLSELAELFGVTVDWLMTGEEPRERTPDQGENAADNGKNKVTKIDSSLTSSSIELGIAPTHLPADVPVFGTVAGGNDGFFQMNGDPVDYVRRPPGIARNPKAYGMYVTNDSMSPRFDHGELVYVDPNRPPSPGCDVVYELHAPEGEPGLSFIKRLVRRSPTHTTFQQFSPPGTFEVPTKTIKRMHRILTTAELFGI